MKHEIKNEAGRTVLHIADQLVAADRADFDAVLPNVMAKKAPTIEVDLSGLTFMDSAGLGMLLTLREHADKHNGTVVLANPQGAVQEMLELACFDTLFQIQSN